ncbi:hypothetical protein DMA11_03605 [Marinilabiliaceae bacterium JC017]|nr:hypothetical protein DMA11_03605 [Marinilabiliaceae bacterium JC017]
MGGRKRMGRGRKIGKINWCQEVRFFLQKSASAFSVSKGDVDKVCKYILAQPQHHKVTSFTEAYEQFITPYPATLEIDK